jgi:hypothetical protein
MENLKPLASIQGGRRTEKASERLRGWIIQQTLDSDEDTLKTLRSDFCAYSQFFRDFLDKLQQSYRTQDHLNQKSSYE